MVSSDKRIDKFKEMIAGSKSVEEKDALTDKINRSRLPDVEKISLLEMVEVRMNEIEQSQIDAEVTSGNKKRAAELIDRKQESINDEIETQESAESIPLPPNVKAVEATEEEMLKYQKEKKLYGWDPKNRIAKILVSLLICSLLFLPAAFAGSTDKATLGGIYSGDTYDCAVNSSGDFVCQSDASFGGDLAFRTNLLANGRYNGGALILQSSSTPIGATQLAYSVIEKRIGGAGGKDETNGGTRLANGTIGQVISFICIYREGSGTWIITPVTKTGFSTVTMDAVGEHVTLLYVNDTVGWIIQGSNATIA